MLDNFLTEELRSTYYGLVFKALEHSQHCLCSLFLFLLISGHNHLDQLCRQRNQVQIL